MFQRGKAVHGLAHMCLKIIVWRWLSGVVAMWFKSWCILWAHQVMCVHIIQKQIQLALSMCMDTIQITDAAGLGMCMHTIQDQIQLSWAYVRMPIRTGSS